MELTFEFEFEFWNLEFGSLAASVVVPVGPVALPLMVRCDIITKG